MMRTVPSQKANRHPPVWLEPNHPPQLLEFWSYRFGGIEGVVSPQLRSPCAKTIMSLSQRSVYPWSLLQSKPPPCAIALMYFSPTRMVLDVPSVMALKPRVRDRKSV